MLMELRPVIARMAGEPIYRAVSRDALRRRDTLIVVAEQAGTLAGVVVAATRWKRYWRGFVLRHPLLGARVLWHRLRKVLGLGRRTREPQVDEPGRLGDCVSATPSGRSWSESSPAIAKVAYVGVRQQCRGRGIGDAIYRHLFAILRQRGVARVDAHIDYDNIASVWFHWKTGWRIERWGSGYFATVNLEEATTRTGDAGV